MKLIEKRAIIETIDAVFMDNPTFISHLGRKALMDIINALPTQGEEWVSVETTPSIDNNDQEFLCEDYDGYVVCWYKQNGFIECYTLMEVSPIRYKPLLPATQTPTK